MEKKIYSLSEIGTELPFRVPDQYFEQFALQMEVEIGSNAVSKSSVLKSWLYMAALFVGIFVMGQLFFQLYQNHLEQKHENYEAYLLQQVDEGVLMDYYVEDASR